MTQPTVAGRTTTRMMDQAEYRFYLCLAFPLFLLAAIVRRFAPRRMDRPRSIFAEAMEIGHSVIPWVFDA
ncbi:MAG: hypothetical protein AAGJ87_16840 [Pseudomonadota bacterium]